jgi:hypothetical protein
MKNLYLMIEIHKCKRIKNNKELDTYKLKIKGF